MFQFPLKASFPHARLVEGQVEPRARHSQDRLGASGGMDGSAGVCGR